MAFRGIDFDQFAQLKNKYFHLRPIEQSEHLKGRQAQLSQIRRNLSSPGRQIFIFGHRGVGKTSLARTAAFAAPGHKFDPVYVACDREGTFFDMAAAMVDEIAGHMDQTKNSTNSEKASLLASILGYERSREDSRVYPKFESLSQFVQALKGRYSTCLDQLSVP